MQTSEILYFQSHLIATHTSKFLGVLYIFFTDPDNMPHEPSIHECLGKLSWITERAKLCRSSESFPHTTNTPHGIFFFHAKFWLSIKITECPNTDLITIILLVSSYLSSYHFQSFAWQPALLFPTPTSYWKPALCKALTCRGKHGYLTWQQPKWSRHF